MQDSRIPTPPFAARHAATSTAAVLLALVIATNACNATPPEGAGDDRPGPEVSERTLAARAELARASRRAFGAPPAIPDGPLSSELAEAVDRAFVAERGRFRWTAEHSTALRRIARSQDPRLAWLVVDMMRVVSDYELRTRLADAAARLLAVRLDRDNPWSDATDHLIAWDVPAPPGYLDVKRSIYTLLLPEWASIFAPGDIDWRHVTWGGVRIDDRAFDKTDG